MTTFSRRRALGAGGAILGAAAVGTAVPGSASAAHTGRPGPEERKSLGQS